MNVLRSQDAKFVAFVTKTECKDKISRSVTFGHIMKIMLEKSILASTLQMNEQN